LKRIISVEDAATHFDEERPSGGGGAEPRLILRQGHNDRKIAAVSSLRAVAMLTVSCLVGTACDGSGGGVIVPGGDDRSDVFDMTGTWTLTLNSVDLPFTFDCTGDLVGREFSFCESFEVTVVQDGLSFLPGSGTGQGEPFCDSQFEMSGSSTVRQISGTIVRTRTLSLVPPQLEIQNMEFQAGVIGDVATFALARLTLQGVTGECTMGGSYLGLRAGSP